MNGLINIILILYYIIINVVLFVLMGLDKSYAVKNKYRIKEATLLTTSLFGGGIGGLVGMNVFRHKTKKYYVLATFIASIIIHAIILLFLYGII